MNCVYLPLQNCQNAMVIVYAYYGFESNSPYQAISKILLSMQVQQLGDAKLPMISFMTTMEDKMSSLFMGEESHI